MKKKRLTKKQKLLIISTISRGCLPMIICKISSERTLNELMMKIR